MQEERNKLYVGNLDFGMTDEELKNAVEEKGVVTQSVKIITDKATGRSKGFGFVEVSSEEEVQKLIEAMNGQDINGRKIRVSKAMKSKPRFERNDRMPRYR